MGRTGMKLLDLMEEGIGLRERVAKHTVEGYRNPLWYDDAKARISEIENELSELLDNKGCSCNCQCKPNN